MDLSRKTIKSFVIYILCFAVTLYVFDMGVGRLKDISIDAQEPGSEEVDDEQDNGDAQTEGNGANNEESGEPGSEDADEEEEEDIPMPPPEQITVPGEKLFHLETSVGTQSAFNGKIPIHLYVKPFIDSSKAELRWELPRGLEAAGDTEKWFRMEEDEAETFTFYVIPKASGHYEIVANVTAWRYDTNYVDSIVIEIDIDDNLLITPQTAEYKRNKTFLTLGVGVAIVLGIVGIFFGVKLGIKRFKMWMAED